jgi:putative hydrolase of the HAD superfamily
MNQDIAAVLFDLDGTLLDDDAAWRAGMKTMLVRCPQVERSRAFEAWIGAMEESFDRYLGGELTFEESRIARIRSWSDSLSIVVEPGDEPAWFDDYLAGYEAAWAAFDDVEFALAKLEGFRLGVITNGEGTQQRAKITALGLDSAFEVVICSGDVGYAKPDQRIFEVAAGRLGLPPDRCLFVGDRRDSDARGALAAGMSALWLNRQALVAPDELVEEIRTLRDLPAINPGGSISATRRRRRR